MSTLANIIYICVDQLGAKFLGCYGSSIISMPTIDRLASEGIRFDRYYATHPICAPNRATMLTGRSSCHHGVVINNIALSDRLPTYAQLLRKQGYRTGGFGKFHQWPMAEPAPQDLRYLGFDEAVVSEDPKWGPYTKWVKENHPDQYRNALALVNGQSGSLEPDVEVDTRQGATEEQALEHQRAYHGILSIRQQTSPWERMYVSPIDPKAHDTTFITDCALQFLNRQQAAEPFFCHISYVDPHDPYNPPEPYASMFDPDTMPEALPAEWIEQGPWFMRELQDTYLGFSKIAENKALVRRLRALYMGQLRLIDEKVAKIIDLLKAKGLWENSILVFSSDHGDHLGDHALVSKGLAHYDAAIRCPLVIGGGAISSRGATDRLSSTLDLFPTFCDWAQVPQDDRPLLEGLSFADTCGDMMSEPPVRDIVVSLPGVTSLITGDGKRQSWYPEYGQGVQYDLFEDPDELHPHYFTPDPDLYPWNIQDHPLYKKHRGRVMK